MNASRAALTLDSSVTAVSGVGPVRQRQLADTGIHTVRDLLYVLPVRYEDRRHVTEVGGIREAGRYTLRGRLRGLERIRLRRKRMSLVRGTFFDGTGELAAIWFNRPYLVQQTRPEVDYLVHGEVRPKDGGWQLVNASVSTQAEGEITPIYPTRGGLGPATVSRLVTAALQALDLDNAAARELPAELLERRRLPELGRALLELHRPDAETDIADLGPRASPAHGRLVYGELLELQIELALHHERRIRTTKSHTYRLDAKTRRRIGEIVPFELTGAQQRVFEEITSDLTSEFPMMRLLQGDVGSGKTIVAAMALVLAAESGLQSALMAPTELLAEQHFRELERILGDRYRLALLTGSAAGRSEARAALASGELPIVVGTHALIQEGVVFRRPGLVVVDEQHRFGVGQRRSLQQKGDRLDLLVMTATPIPRSLALTVYGDLELSVIDELPPGRTPVMTEVLPTESRLEVYDAVERQLSKGGQAYIVCPLIEDSEAVAATSIAGLEREIARRFAAFRPVILHGATPADERERAMHAFAVGDSKLLLATTVIEVGVDVPAANTMVIESAERFGLSQLHQLRGRVGRGQGKATCFALHGGLSEDARRRLEIFGRTTDGFEIAEADLGIRGPGDVLGTRQAGVPLLQVARIVEDREWLEKARADALEVVAAPEAFGAGPLIERVRAEGRLTGKGLAGA